MHATLSSERIGANLKRLIKESKYVTQDAFAKAYKSNYKSSERNCNVDTRTVRRWVEAGVAKIDTIAKIAEILEVDVRALLF